VPTVRELLIEHYLAWQKKSGVIKKQNEFAVWIGESEKYLSLIMNGRKPSKRQVVSFAEIFNDPRFYDAAGMDRPEKYLDYAKRNWNTIPKELKKKIADQIAQYTTEPPPDDPE
jgi:hypothetical protein